MSGRTWWVVALLLVPVALPAQRQPVAGPLAIGLSAERRGDFKLAAENYFAWLDGHPADVQALQGLSRVLPALERRAELLPALRLALARDSTDFTILSLGVRTHALLGQVDSTRAWVNRWATLVDGEEEPFREWAQSALEARDRSAAKEALESGRRRIAHPAALAPELAQFRQAEGDIAGATQEWIRAITTTPGFRASALLLLGDLLPAQRTVVLSTLAASDEVEAKRLSGLLRIRWGEPEQGVAELSRVMPEGMQPTVALLRMVFDDLRGRTDRPAIRARARALELQAAVETDGSRVRTWMDAARAWADAGEEREARRLLSLVAADPHAPSGMATAASSALFGVLLAEGKPAEAESLLVSLRGVQSLDDQERDTRRVALAWALAGDIARGDRLLESDSTVAGFSARGMLRAYAGDLAAASMWLELAGPYDDERERSVERVRVLSLLKAIDRDTSVTFGTGLLALERGDTTTAVTTFVTLADSLAPPGQAALRYFAGELALARRDTAGALVHFEAADLDSAPAAAPAARFARAQVLAARGDVARAQELLEELILDFPTSAVVPAARRSRDALRGAIPGGGSGR